MTGHRRYGADLHRLSRLPPRTGSRFAPRRQRLQAAGRLEFRGKSKLCVHDTVGGQIGGGFGGDWCVAHRFDGHADGRSATLELGSSLTFDC